MHIGNNYFIPTSWQ